MSEVAHPWRGLAMLLSKTELSKTLLTASLTLVVATAKGEAAKGEAEEQEEEEARVAVEVAAVVEEEEGGAWLSRIRLRVLESGARRRR